MSMSASSEGAAITAKAVPVVAVKTAKATTAGDYDENEEDGPMRERKLSNASDYRRRDTDQSKQSTDTEYEDVPLLDIGSLDLRDSSVGRGGIRYDRSESGPNDMEEDLMMPWAPVPDKDVDRRFVEAAQMEMPEENHPHAAAASSAVAAMIPSKPQALDCPEGMAPEVFYQLPPEVQREVSSSNNSNNDHVIDPDILASLPENLRQEVLDQQQQRNSGSSGLKKMSVSFSSSPSTAGGIERTDSKRMDRKALSKSTKEFLSGFDIGEEDFDGLDEEVQADLLAEKRKGETKSPSNANNSRNSSGGGEPTTRQGRMRALSLTKSTKVFLADLDIDEEDFDDLDEDVKTSLLANRKNSIGSDNASSSSSSNRESEYDQDMLASLPEDLREEILEEERRKRRHSTGSAGGGGAAQRPGAHHSNVPAGYDPATFEALPLEMQRELMDAANDGIVYSADGYGSDSIARAPLAVATAAGQEKATYEGDYNNSGKRHGEGTLTWANGDVYKGWFKNGFMEGRGTINFRDGECTFGTFTMNLSSVKFVQV